MLKKNKKHSRNKKAWFYKIRGSYLPANKYGWLSYLPFMGYLAFSLIVGIKDISKIWAVILFVVANWVAAGAVMTMLAIRTS
jgi:hypothetical protein